MKNSIKKIILPIMAFMFIYSINSCSNDDDAAKEKPIVLLPYEDIKFNDIKNFNPTAFSSNNLNVVEDNVHLIGVNSVILYKLASDSYGKLQITNINDNDKFRLSMIATTYDKDGNMISEITNPITVREGFHCELEPMVKELVTPNEGGFKWKIKAGGIELNPVNNAVFALYE